MSAVLVQVDPVFEGLKGGPGTLIKYNPLSNVSSAEVWNFLRAMVRSFDLHRQCIFTPVARAHPLMLLLLLPLDKNEPRQSQKPQLQQLHL